MKIGRQAKIIELIGRHDIETQEELCRLLNLEGYDVTQATVSRDIRALKLTKVTYEDGRSIYSTLQSQENVLEKRMNILRDAYVSMDFAQNLLVIKTLSGLAMATGSAIDNLNFKEVVGCIAGDDTVFVATKNAEDCLSVMQRIRKIIEE